jgi:M6 family metalloprotease-like protein
VRGLATTLATLGIIVSAGVSAHEAPSLKVHPVVDPAGPALQPPRRGTKVMTPEQSRLHRLRSERWRAFDDVLSAPGMDWSRETGPRGASKARMAASTLAGGPIPPDTIRVAFIRIDFLNDRDGSQSTGNGRFDLSGPDPEVPPIDRPPHNRSFFQKHFEALSRYYDAQSYGTVVIDGDVWPRTENGAYSLSDMADFGPWMFSQEIYLAAVHMFRTMLFAADSQSIVLGDRIPWDNIDRVVLIHAGADLQSDVRQDSPHDIPSFTIGVVDTDVVIFPDSTTRPIDRAAIFPETISQDELLGTLNGVIAHECGHLLFNMADLYNVSTGQSVVGAWSLMDSGNLVGSEVILPDSTILFATGLLPPSVDPFQRQFISPRIPTPLEVSYGDTLVYRSSQRYPDVRKVTLTSDEYLLIENRWLAPADVVSLDQDSVTRVILGPETPDRYEYDALLLGSGILVWHIDESVIPLESYFPVDTALRANPDLGWNSNFTRPGVDVIEADALNDLGDFSPYALSAPYDPFFVGNYATLSDSTIPDLIPHIGTRPHKRMDVLSVPDSVMRVAVFKTWELKGWPVQVSFPPGGPVLLAVDADGNRSLDVCWAGGDPASADSASLFAVRPDGTGLGGGPRFFARLDRKPRREMAAIALGESVFPNEAARGPALFAVSTLPEGPDTSSAGGRVWLIDHLGNTVPGWPAPLPAIVTTPPVIAGLYPNARVVVGCADGRVYEIGLDGNILAQSPVLWASGITGRLAVDLPGTATAPPPLTSITDLVAAGGATGEVAVIAFDGSQAVLMPGWPRNVGPAGFTPDFLWLDFNGAPDGVGPLSANSANPLSENSTTATTATPVACGGGRSLVTHDADRLWAHCLTGEPLPGWGQSQADTLVDALGAGDPDGDGYPEVLIQAVRAGIGFVNLTGRPSPGWPKRPTDEQFPSGSTPLALDVDGDGTSEVVALNASGVIAAMRNDGVTPEGWPLATGVGATGSPVAADLDGDSRLDLVAPDRFGRLFAYRIPVTSGRTPATSWIMLGGDIGRSASLPPQLTVEPPVTFAGPLIKGSLKAYPNPARRKPVSFAYQLTEPSDVEFRILDPSGHEVASFTRAGRPADNLEVWDPGALPAGLYLARLRFRGAGTDRVETIPLGILR